MNRLAEEGFIVLGGPLEGTRDVLLVVRAESAEAMSMLLEPSPFPRGGDPRITIL